MEKQYTLIHGIHRGTLTSRDSGAPEHFETYEAAIEKYQEHRASYRRIGYQIWFAEIVAPDGTKTQLESNPYH